jgi:hypothetical protein
MRYIIKLKKSDPWFGDYVQSKEGNKIYLCSLEFAKTFSSRHEARYYIGDSLDKVDIIEVQ